MLAYVFGIASMARWAHPYRIRASLEQRVVPVLGAPYEIYDGLSSLYLRRWTVAEQLDGSCVYLHQFMRSDQDRELHSHPWPAGTSVILLNGYREERRVTRSAPWCPYQMYDVEQHVYQPGDVVQLKSDTFHRVDLIGTDAWTLICVGPKIQHPEGVDGWGFWNRETGLYTPWRTFVEAKGLKAQTTPRTITTPMLRPLVKTRG